MKDDEMVEDFRGKNKLNVEISNLQKPAMIARHSQPLLVLLCHGCVLWWSLICSMFCCRPGADKE